MNARKTLPRVASESGEGYQSGRAAPVVRADAHRTQVVRRRKGRRGCARCGSVHDKPVLVYYWATWCTYCERYDKNHYRNETIRAAMDDYVLLAINIDDPGNGTALVRQHQATYPPQHRIMTPNGDTVESVEGYIGRDELLATLEKRSEEAT
ncbi:thioredoxin family protein [Haloferax sp. wsp5]|nr:thioredoxin family protein [Haloferax sp. wsp5]